MKKKRSQVSKHVTLTAACAVGGWVAVLAPALGFSADAQANDTYLSGVHVYNTLTVHVGDRIIATGDLHIVCLSSATIDGLIDAQPGFSIRIEAPVIIAQGSITGGEGVSSLLTVGADGGHGGSVTLLADYLFLESGIVVRGGDGGRAGRGGHGGNGGDVIIGDSTSGFCPVIGGTGAASLIGGNGGPGGLESMATRRICGMVELGVMVGQ